MPAKRADDLGYVTHRQREIKAEGEEFVFEENKCSKMYSDRLYLML